MKKTGYKYRIEQELLKEKWEIKTIGSDFEWWDNEHWKLEYQYDSSLSFFLCFIIDPQLDNQKRKEQGIYEIKASAKFPKNWNDNEHLIASISLSKRKFEEKLQQFIRDISLYKMEK